MRTLIALAIAVGCLVMAGCNTIEGVGRDIQWAGQELQDAAD